MRLLLLLAFLLLDLACSNGEHSVKSDPDLSVALVATMPDDIQAFPDELQVGEPLITPPAEPVAKPLFHVDTSRAYIGVTEDPKDSNRGTAIEAFLASVGLAPSQDANGKWRSFPYCAAFVSYCMNKVEDIRLPTVRTARARSFITGNSIRANEVQRGTVPIEPGSLIIWKAKRDPQDTSGHVGFVVEWNGQEGITIEGNTGSGDAGSQRDGGGVYQRKRMLSPGSAFRITDFTPVVYQ